MIFKIKISGFLPDLREMFHRWFLYRVMFVNGEASSPVCPGSQALPKASIDEGVTERKLS